MLHVMESLTSKPVPTTSPVCSRPANLLACIFFIALDPILMQKVLAVVSLVGSRLVPTALFVTTIQDIPKPGNLISRLSTVLSLSIQSQTVAMSSSIRSRTNTANSGRTSLKGLLTRPQSTTWRFSRLLQTILV